MRRLTISLPFLRQVSSKRKGSGVQEHFDCLAFRLVIADRTLDTSTESIQKDWNRPVLSIKVQSTSGKLAEDELRNRSQPGLEGADSIDGFSKELARETAQSKDIAHSREKQSDNDKSTRPVLACNEDLSKDQGPTQEPKSEATPC